MYGLNALVFALGYRSDNFIIGLTDVSPAITAPTLWNYDVCAQYPGVVGDGATVFLPCTSEMPSRRYLIVQVELVNDALNFCEIEVYVRGKLIFIRSLINSQRCKKNGQRLYKWRNNNIETFYSNCDFSLFSSINFVM